MPHPNKKCRSISTAAFASCADVQMRRKPGTSTHLHNFSVRKFELRIIFYAKRLESSRIRLPGSQKSTAGAFKYMIVGNVTYGIGYSNSILLFKITVEFVIVIYDDIDIEKGHIKIRKKGGAGSHNGMKSVVEELQSTDFARIRVGIGQPEFKSDMINYVIGKVSQEEQEILQQGVEKAAKAVEEILKNGIDIAMNKFN